MIKRVDRDEADRVPLPGRDWFSYIGPQNTPTKNVSIGVSVYPPGSKPTGHVHEHEEETVYCASGRGRLVTPEATADLEPGVAVFIPMGTFHATEWPTEVRSEPSHATEADGPEPMELICLFSPPVVPGSYERGSGS